MATQATTMAMAGRRRRFPIGRILAWAGLILMLLIEILMRRDLSLNVKEAVFKVGMVFLMMVVVFVLYNDISKLLPG